jgi:hypothetical protein
MIKRFVFICLIGLFGSIYASNAQNEPIYRPRQPEPQREPWTERITPGGNFGLALGNTLFINVSPLIGYKFTPRFFAGAGPSYIYSRTRLTPTIAFRTNILGGRVFAQHAVIGNFALRGEYELLRAQYPISITSTGDIIEGTTWISNPLAGVAYMIPTGRRSFMNVMLMYNFGFTANEQNRLMYNSPLVFRTGFQF